MVSDHKVPFRINTAIADIREAVRAYPKAAMFELRDQGYTSLYEQLVACILSIRTLDEVSLVTARRLFERARSPFALAALPVDEIETIIHPVSFHGIKAGQIRAIARITSEQYGGELPCDEQVLLGFSGVGIKCAHLALGIACGLPTISVDVHVHRVTNRWGYVDTKTPEQTTAALEQKLPREYWVEINSLLVPFGKHICTGRLPFCSTCPVLPMCRQVGVTRHR